MNRKSFLKSIGVLFTLPFVTPAMTIQQQALDKLPKPIQKQTKIEQKDLDLFYQKPNQYVSGFAVSGVYSMTGSFPAISYCSGIIEPSIASKLRADGIW